MTVEVTRLSSGLSVVTDRMPHLESASLGVWVGAGSRDERADEHGISHLLEHMAFKGTKKRTARQIAETIEAVGGDLNAATIRTVLRETGRFVDPHAAVGIAVAEKEPRDPAVPMVVLSTAHPAKFPDAVEAACGQRPLLPEWLSDLDRRPERVTFLPADQEAVERFVLATSRAAQEGAAA